MKTLPNMHGIGMGLQFALLATATSLPFLFLTEVAHADMCFNSSSQDDYSRDGGDGSGGADSAVNSHDLVKRNVGVGLVTTAKALSSRLRVWELPNPRQGLSQEPLTATGTSGVRPLSILRSRSWPLYPTLAPWAHASRPAQP